MKHHKYLIRRPNYSGNGFLYYSKTGKPWVEDAESATFFGQEEAYNIGLQILEEINVACDIIGPYV